MNTTTTQQGNTMYSCNPLYAIVAMSFDLKTNELLELFAVENTSNWIDCADFRGALAKVLNCNETEIMNRFIEICKKPSTKQLVQLLDHDCQNLAKKRLKNNQKQ